MPFDFDGVCWWTAVFNVSAVRFIKLFCVPCFCVLVKESCLTRGRESSLLCYLERLLFSLSCLGLWSFSTCFCVCSAVGLRLTIFPDGYVIYPAPRVGRPTSPSAVVPPLPSVMGGAAWLFLDSALSIIPFACRHDCNCRVLCQGLRSARVNPPACYSRRPRLFLVRYAFKPLMHMVKLPFRKVIAIYPATGGPWHCRLAHAIADSGAQEVTPGCHLKLRCFVMGEAS